MTLGMSKKSTALAGDGSKQQVAAFRKAARQLGCDESEEKFKDTLRTLGRAKPSPSQPRPKPHKP